MYYAVQNYLQVTLAEVKEVLRLENTYETTLIQESSAGSLTHVVEGIGEIHHGSIVTIAGVDAEVVDIDFAETTLTLDRMVSAYSLPQGTPVTHHYQNRLLRNYLEAAKAQADAFLQNPFEVIEVVNGEPVIVVRIPPEVKSWVLNRITLDYLKPEPTLFVETTREAGSRHFKGGMFDDGGLFTGIEHLRRHTL